MRAPVRLGLVLVAITISSRLAVAGSGTPALPRHADADLRSLPSLVAGARADDVFGDALRRIAEGRWTFRFETFGDQAFWGEVLRRDRIGTDENFFAVGGHSLLAMRVAARLRDLFGVDLRVTALFEAVTVAERGDVERALAQARKRVEGEFEFPYLAHATMEPLTAVCRLSPDKC